MEVKCKGCTVSKKQLTSNILMEKQLNGTWEEDKHEYRYFYCENCLNVLKKEYINPLNNALGRLKNIPNQNKDIKNIIKYIEEEIDRLQEKIIYIGKIQVK